MTMQLLVIRHAIAEDKKAFAKTKQPDTERPLTKGGKKEMALVTRGLPGPRCATVCWSIPPSMLAR